MHDFCVYRITKLSPPTERYDVVTSLTAGTCEYESTKAELETVYVMGAKARKNRFAGIG